MTMTTTNATQGKATNPAFMFAEDEIKHVPLSDIFADTNWNSRSKANVDANESVLGEVPTGEATGMFGLIGSIIREGQDDPVIIRKVEGGKTLGGHNTKCPYELIAGFRRYEALSRISVDETIHKAKQAEGHKQWVPNTPNGTIRAVVKELAPAQARSLNLRENTARSDMTTPDLVFGVRELLTTFKSSKAGIASDLGLSMSYTDKLARIATIHRDVLTHWRMGGEFEGVPAVKRASVDDMDGLSKVDPGRQKEEYKKMLIGKAGPSEGEQTNQRIEKAKSRAEAFGTLLGKLAKAEFLEITDNVPWVDVIEYVVATKKHGFNRNQLRSIASRAEKAYTAAMNATEEEEEEGDEE